MRDLVVEAPPAERASERSGVFAWVVPAILTSLAGGFWIGLPWSTGSVGAGGTVLAAVFAHALALTAGLSLISIVSNRGRGALVQYAISRSLGPWIGGALGVGFFAALSLLASVQATAAAAFVLGLVPPEMLPVERPRELAAALGILLAVIAAAGSERRVLRWSAVAIVAAALALGSMLAGELPTEEVRPLRPGGMQDVFAVLFTAVTGVAIAAAFARGAAAPKRGVTLVAVVALAFGLAIFAIGPPALAARLSESVLRSPGAFVAAAWSPPLAAFGALLAMIQAAALSLAAAGQTLRALAADGLAPKSLAKNGNDPPIAAIVMAATFAVAGVLVADLRALAEGVTELLLACFAIASASAAFERWTDPEYRPQVALPPWVSLLGAFGSVIAILTIAPWVAAMVAIGAGLALGTTLLRRKAKGGEMVEGAWAAVVRFALRRIKGEGKQFRPNMLIFATETPRPELIEIGRAIVGTRGMLTHVTLVPGAAPKPQTDEKLEEAHRGLFARIKGTEDPYAEIPALASSFGLRGLEANSVLLPWPRDERDQERFVELYRRLLDLDQNVLLLRHDPARDFGRREQIDLWWDGREHTGRLMLNLAYLLRSSPAWKDARVRLLVITEPQWDEALARRTLERMISEARVDAEGVLLAPLTEDQPLAERVRQQSGGADLLIVGLPDLEPGESGAFVSRCNDQVRPWGTCLFLRAARGAQDTRIVFRERVRRGEEQPPTELTLETPQLPRLAGPIDELEARLQDAIARFETDFARPALEEELELLRRIGEEALLIGRLERRLRWRSARRFVVRGHVEAERSRLNDAVLRLARVFSAASPRTDSAEAQLVETEWQRREREALWAIEADLGAAVAALPAEVLVPSEPSDWEPGPEDPPSFRLKKQLVRLGLALGLRQPDRGIPLRALAEYHLSARIYDGLEQAARALGMRRFDALRRARRLVVEAERLYAGLLADLDDGTTPTVDTEAFRETLRNELASLGLVVEGAIERFQASAVQAGAILRDRVRAAGNELVADLGRPEVAYAHRRLRPIAKQRRAHRKAMAELEASPELWSIQHRAMADALCLDLEVLNLSIEGRRAAQQLYRRVRRDLETGPISQLKTAEEVMSRALAHLPEEGESDRERPPPDPKTLRESFTEAADDLRGTWDRPYRPETRELLDQLLAALGRAAERVPESVATLNEADLEAVFEGRLERTRTVFPTRRLAQAFLEEIVAEPARRVLADLPQLVEETQETLVDACRLVAFELEHVVDEGATEEEAGEVTDDTHLAEVIRERINRVRRARERVEAYLNELKSELIDAPSRALEGARQAVTGAAPERSRRAGARGARWSQRVDAASAALGAAVAARWRRLAASRAEPARRRRGLRGIERTLTDEVLELRDKLAPRAEVQASLPLVYRRLFGRAPLETRDLAVGRGLELEAARRLIERWRQGAGGPIAIVGEPRSGRSTLAAIVVREMLADRTVVRVQPPPGGTASPEELNQVVARAVGGREGRSAEGALRTMPPGAVFVIDDLGRWVERTASGLSALELWLRIFGRLGDRHLFILTSSSLAWSYVEPLIGLSERFLGTLVTPPVTAGELRQLLLLRQETSGLDLAFEEPDIAFARRALGTAALRGFARIYARTRGNIGDALDLWRRSIVGATEKRVTLRIEPEPDTRVLSQLPIRWCSGVIAVGVHRGVNVARMARVMRLSRDDANALLTDLERAGLLAEDSAGVWTLDPILTPYVLRALRTRGMIP